MKISYQLSLAALATLAFTGCVTHEHDRDEAPPKIERTESTSIHSESNNSTTAPDGSYSRKTETSRKNEATTTP